MNAFNLPLVSVVIVNYNGLKFLKECLDSLKRSDYPNLEIILMDNASSDGSVDFVSRNYPCVLLSRNHENLGFCAANNKASYLARGEYLFFLNNDTKIGPDVLTRLVRKMQSDPGLGICGCRISSYDGLKHFHTGLGADIYGYPIVLQKIFYVEGSCLLIKKELFHKLGGFDEKYLFFHEDIDLAWRVWLSGFKVEADHEALVQHFYGGTAGGMGLKNGYSTTYFRRYLAERNNIRTLLKNYGPLRLLLILPVYFAMNLAEIALLLLTFNWRAATCYFKAYGWNITQLSDTLVKRKIIQKSRVVPDREIIKQMYKGSGKIFIFKKIGIPKFS